MTGEHMCSSGEPDPEVPTCYVYDGRTFLGLYSHIDRNHFEAFGQDSQALGSFAEAVDAVRAITAAVGR